MNGPGNNMNFLKVIQEQDKSMKLTWSTSFGGVTGCVQFQGANKLLDEYQEPNALVASEV